MKLLKCKLCRGEMDIISSEKTINKKVKCQQCGYSNEDELGHGYKAPEVVVIRKRPIS